MIKICCFPYRCSSRLTSSLVPIWSLAFDIWQNLKVNRCYKITAEVNNDFAWITYEATLKTVLLGLSKFRRLCTAGSWLLSLSIFVIFKVLTVIVHSGVPDGSNSAVLEGGKIHCLLYSRSGRSHAQRREADVTPARATRKYKKY